MCQNFDSNRKHFSQVSRPGDDWGHLLTTLPEYQGYHVQILRVAHALVTIALSPWGRARVSNCSSSAKRLLEPPGRLSAEDAESLLLDLYAKLHDVGSVYTLEERRDLNARHGYINYAGGLSPILRAGRYLTETSVSVDLGAGNGLQGLLLQAVYPHRKTIQVELSGALIETGRRMQTLVGIPDHRMVWEHRDIASMSLEGVDFVYLYRPVHPEGRGEALYRRMAGMLEKASAQVTVFSVADCLGKYLSDSFGMVFSDGHLTCYQRRPESTAAKR